MVQNYSDLTIKQFIRCKTITSLETDPIQRNVKMLAEISGRTIDEVESMPINKMLKELKSLTEIDQLKPDERLKMKFKVGGRRFECIWKSQELTAAQYIDVTHFINGDVVNNIHNILAALCVERTILGTRKKYNGEKHKEIADLFYNHMKIATAYPIMLFFCKYSKELEGNILTSLEAQVKELQIAFTKNGDGLR